MYSFSVSLRLYPHSRDKSTDKSITPTPAIFRTRSMHLHSHSSHHHKRHRVIHRSMCSGQTHVIVAYTPLVPHGHPHPHTRRSKKLFNLAAQLKTICSKHSIPCVVINQVSDLFEPEIQRPSSSSTYNRFAGPAYTHTHENASASASSVSSSASSPSLSPHANTLNHKRVSAKNNKYANPSPEFTCDMKRWSVVSSGRRVVPTLGITWAACINTRLFLSRNTVYNTASTSHMYSHAQTHGNGDGSNSTQSASTYQNTSRTNSSDNYNDSSSRGSSSTYSNSNSNNDNNNNNNVLNKNGTPTHESAHSAHIDRKIHVIFSSHLSPGSCSFVVGADGVQGMNQ